MDVEQTQMIRKMVPYAKFLDIEVLSSDPDEIRARMEWRDDLCTTNGVLHGGVIMGFADTMGGTCAFLNLPEDAETSTLESKTNFFRPVTGGTIEAVSRPLHVGKKTIVVEVTVRDENGKDVAKTTQSQMVDRS